MNALTCRHSFLMPCPARATLVASGNRAGQRTSRSTAAPAVAEPATAEAHPTRAQTSSRFRIPETWRRASRFAGGLLIGATLWAVVFAASAATQFSVLG